MRKSMTWATTLALLISTISGASADSVSAEQKMTLIKTISGDISPKSVRASTTGFVSAHNMMYRHSVTIYDAKNLDLVATVPDRVRLSDLGFSGYTGTHQGAPVEGAYSPDGSYLYVTTTRCMGKVLTAKEPINVSLQINMTARSYIESTPRIGLLMPHTK